jgi:outer membrane biosynthesis protein TonB
MAEPAEERTMALRFGVILPRVFVVVIVSLLATATITFAAETRGGPAVQPPAQSAAARILLVPDVRGQAYVFAKSTLEEAGFAWRVSGAQGYAANLVSSQSPAPGSRVYDTGAPTILLSLRANSSYPQAGTPENASSFSGTPLRLVGVVSKPKAKPKAKPRKKTAPAKKPVAKKRITPKPKPKPKAKPKPNVKRPTRPPAFVVPGAKAEPLDEAPLTTRAKNLDHWLSTHRSPTNENVRYWLYQHAWIVTGARLGWWHGAQALETLIAVDRRVERYWEIGKRSERVARAALAEVRRKSR